MMKEVHDIHDRGYRKLFGNKVIFRQLIETFVHEPWVKELDFENCEALDKSFVSDHYKETESDLIYKLKLKGKEVYIFILLEFQSTVYRFMALRVLNYLTDFYMDYVQSHKNVRALPPVFPVVLYNGDKSWTAPLNLSALVENSELLGKYALNFEYLKIVEHEYTKEELLKIRNIVSTLFLTETCYDLDLLKKEFVTVFKQEDRQAAALFFNWFEQLVANQRIDQADYHVLRNHLYHNVEEVQTMLETAIKKERQLFYERGREEEKIAVAKNMLNKGLSVTLISEITGLSEEEIENLKNENTNVLTANESNN